MTPSLKTLCFNIWKDKYSRKGISSEYKPYFIRYIGIENEEEYPRILKTIYQKSEDCPYSLFYENEIPFTADMDIISYVSGELEDMDTSDLKGQDISLFTDPGMNRIFLESLDETVKLAASQENFFNKSVKDNFIMKLIVWTYQYVRPISKDFKDSDSPKCFYYGNISRHEIYFLMMLYMMTFDVIYINPLKDCDWAEIDTIGLSEMRSDMHISPVKPLNDIISNAEPIEREDSATLQIQEEVGSVLFNGDGLYRPWQFINGTTKPVFVKGTIYDLENNVNEPAKVRQGFSVKGDTVYVPNLVYQIDGTGDRYSELVRKCISSKDAFVSEACGNDLLNGGISQEDRFQLTFCQSSDGQFDAGEIKKLSFYRWTKYRDSLEDFMLNKINEAFRCGIYARAPDQNTKFAITCSILSLSDEVLKFINGFDFTGDIPKLIIFLDGQDSISEEILYVIGYLITVGVDVIIFDPSGLFSSEEVLNPDMMNVIRLEEMRYDLTLDSVKREKKAKGFFARLFDA